MKITKICPLLEPKINKIVDMHKRLILSQIIGDYDTYKNLHKEYATYSVKNFELSKNIKFPKINVPVFSKEGFNILKIMVRDFFRKKTPDEITLSKLYKQMKLEKKFNL